MDWYEENIEAPIRPHVRLLRDNGFNTATSCGHRMYVTGDLAPDDVRRLNDTLFNAGYSDFRLIVTRDTRHDRSFIFELCFPLADGSYHPIPPILTDWWGELYRRAEAAGVHLAGLTGTDLTSVL